MFHEVCPKLLRVRGKTEKCSLAQAAWRWQMAMTKQSWMGQGRGRGNKKGGSGSCTCRWHFPLVCREGEQRPRQDLEKGTESRGQLSIFVN